MKASIGRFEVSRGPPNHQSLESLVVFQVQGIARNTDQVRFEDQLLFES